MTPALTSSRSGSPRCSLGVTQQRPTARFRPSLDRRQVGSQAIARPGRVGRPFGSCRTPRPRRRGSFSGTGRCGRRRRRQVTTIAYLMDRLPSRRARTEERGNDADYGCARSTRYWAILRGSTLRMGRRSRVVTAPCPRRGSFGPPEHTLRYGRSSASGFVGNCRCGR
jgi:hypothetical protein